MSNQPNGQPYYGSQNYQNQYQNSQYRTQNPQSQSQYRRSSFDTGDDAHHFDQGQPSAGQADYSYGRTPSTGGTATLPYRRPSQTPLTGYQHQAQPNTSSYGSYNPASYQTQSYAPQAYGSPQPQYQASYHQPYVPAAYGESNLNRTASTYNNSTYASQSSYMSGPPPPPRPAQYSSPNPQDYTHQTDSASGYTISYGGYQQQGPASPGPPPVPYHTSSVSRPYSHSSGTSQQQTAYGYSDASSNLSSQGSTDIDRHHSSASRVSAVSNLTGSSGRSNPTPPVSYGYNDRHPTGRTLPGLPSESESEHGDYYIPNNNSSAGYDDLMSHIDAAIGTSAGTVGRNGGRDDDPLFSTQSPHLAMSPDERPTHNGININYGAFANDSDAEAAAGLAAMQAADAQEAAEEARRRSSNMQSDPRNSDKSGTDDSDYGGYDLSLAGGGYAGTMHYGDDLPVPGYSSRPTSNYENNNTSANRMNSVRSSGLSSDGRASQISGYDPVGTSSSAFAPFPIDVARVDAGGTGGLTEPSAHPRRLSYEDGDEAHMDESSGNESRESIPDLFFHPGMSPQRPLPPPPSSSDTAVNRTPSYGSSGIHNAQRLSAYDAMPRLYPSAPDAVSNDSLSPSMVPRSTSLASARSQPRTEQPARSKTDADRARLLKQSGKVYSEYDSPTPRTDIGSLDLPAIPRKRFDPTKISSDQYRRCSEPWALSAILAWLRAITEEETDLKENLLQTAISSLFEFKVPTMSTIEAEELAITIVSMMFDQGVLVKDEEWVRFGAGEMCGVLWQLTGAGCYSPKLHLPPTPKQGRCYAHLCMRTLKKAELDIKLKSLPEADWATFYKLKKEDIEGKEKWEIELQNQIHEMVTSEEKYMRDLEVVRQLMREPIKRNTPPIIFPEKKQMSFVRDVFGQVDAVYKVNEDYLLPQLKYRQTEQGPWISGFGDILREWIRRAKPAYVNYAGAYPKADLLFREELKRNGQFAALIESVQKMEVAGRLAWDSQLKAPITRLQRYSFMIEAIVKTMNKHVPGMTSEKFAWNDAMDQIRAATHEADLRVNENNKKVELTELGRKLKLRPHMQKEVSLALDQLGRQVLYRGDLQRQGGKGIAWVDTHAILFDHYLILAKHDYERDANGNRTGEFLDVSKSPVPMDLISLESANEPAVVKSTMRGITAVAPPQGRGGTPDARLARTQSQASGSLLQHTNTGLSGGSGSSSIANQTTIDQKDSKEDKILYPFKVKHLGKTEVYTLYAPSAERRQEWCEAIVNAKTQHAEALHAQNAEPFKLRVLADTAFGSDYSLSRTQITIKGTPLDRAIKEVENKYKGAGRPAPICRSPVNCATVFNQPYGRLMCAVGTDVGVYISEYQNPRGWIRSIPTGKVTQIAVLEDFNLLIVLQAKQLVAYHLDIVCPPSGPPVPQTDATNRKAPQKLSGNKDVGFFIAGKMKERALVFYQKREGINSIFKILEPVLQKSATSKSRWLGGSSRKGQTDFFRDYDEFYIPADTYGLNMFHSSLAVATKRGMEVLTLDKKQPWAVPNLEADTRETKTHLESIAARLKDLQPLGMFRLSDAEFLVAFSECAVYVNKLGDVSRSVVMEFVGRANHACLYGPYLILFNDDFVEIRDALNGRLKQVVAAKDIRMLDDAGNPMPGTQGQGHGVGVNQGGVSLGGGPNGLGMQGYNACPRTVKVSMLHPEYEKGYIVVELVEKVDQQ